MKIKLERELFNEGVSNLRPIVDFSDEAELDKYLFYVEAILDAVEMQQDGDNELGSHRIKKTWFEYALYRDVSIKEKKRWLNESS